MACLRATSAPRGRRAWSAVSAVCQKARRRSLSQIRRTAREMVMALAITSFSALAYGALLGVAFAFVGVDEVQRQRFMKHFDLSTQRGGG